MKRKNLFVGMFALASMLLATSCSQDDLGNALGNGDYVSAKFTIETPDGIGTRAEIGDGTKADKVKCVVFDATGEEITGLTKTLDISGKKATYETRLVKGQAYRIAFFAYNEAANAYNVNDLKSITINDAVSNIEARDAFTNKIDIAANETMTAIEQDVYLYRPFAQLNLGAYKDDIAAAKAAGIEVKRTQVKVSNVYKTFSAYDDAVVGEASEGTYTLGAIPTEDLMVDLDGDGTPEAYEYLALNYLLVGDKGTEKSLTDVEFVWNTSTEGDGGLTNNPATTFKNVPVQRNYRTNIIGYLLTNPAKFNIIIDSDFQKPDYNVFGWDGSEVKQPSSTDKEWTIKSAAEWAYIAANGAQGKNIKLDADIDFGGQTVKNFGFAGEFDGQGHKMSNMTLAPKGSNYSNGLFQGDASTGNLTVKNVTLENVNVDCNDPDQGYAGVIIGDVQSRTVTLEGVKVENANVKGVQSVAGLVGFVASGTTLNVTNCSVNNSKISNYAVDNESGYTAGLVGRPVGTVNVTNSTVTNTTIDAYYAPRRGEASIQPVVGGKADLKGGAGTVVNKTCYVASSETFAAAMKLNVKNLNVELGADVEAPTGTMGNNEYGGNSTETITIDGKSHTIKFIHPNVSHTSITVNTANNSLLTIKNATLTNNRGNDGWLLGNIYFWGNVNLENVKSKQITLHGGATLTNVDITVPEGGDTYGLWIVSTKQTVNLTNVNINATNGGHRGIAIKDEYTGTGNGPLGKVTLNVKDGSVKSKKKAAILVTSTEGANITIDNFDISGVEADKVNAVWYDKGDGTNINVTGGSKIAEPANP